jgi:lysyl-tRNA synthetase class 2
VEYMAEDRIQTEQDINELLKIKRAKLAELQENGKDPFQVMKYQVTNHSSEIINNFENFEGKTVSIAGRIMSKRVMGKASFCNIRDLGGDVQAYVKRDEIGEDTKARVLQIIKESGYRPKIGTNNPNNIALFFRSAQTKIFSSNFLNELLSGFSDYFFKRGCDLLLMPTDTIPMDQ